MKIEPISVISAHSRICLHFRCAAGEARAIWTGKLAPVCGVPIDVEADIDVFVSLGDNAKIVESGEFRISASESTITIEGFIEGQDEDGMAYLRLSDDCLIMVEAASRRLEGKWIVMEVPDNSLLLTPMGQQIRRNY